MNGIFDGARLAVVKVGSALLVDQAKGELRRAWLESLCADVAALKKNGTQVILVSSGSIALGRRLLKLASGPLNFQHTHERALAHHRHMKSSLSRGNVRGSGVASQRGRRMHLRKGVTRNPDDDGQHGYQKIPQPTPSATRGIEKDC